MYKVHRLSERSTTINSRKWENNKTFYIMEDIFKIVEKRRNHWKEHKYNYNKDKYRICTYIHYYSNETVPFYIGQGTLYRAFNMNRHERTNAWNDKVIDINLVNVVIYKIDISKSESLKYEQELIAKYSLTNNLVNYNTCDITNSQLRITNNINKKEIACFSLDGKHIKTFENIKQAAYEYFTSVSIISKCIKDNKPFRGIIYWKRI